MPSIIDQVEYTTWCQRLFQYDPGSTLAWRQGQPVSATTFFSHAITVADSLPKRAYAMNLCEDRYLFTVGFFAALLRGQTNLLPLTRIAAVCEEIAADYPDSYCLTEAPREDLKLKQLLLALPDGSQPLPGRLPEIDSDHVAAIAFTSGSTGKARPNSKPWRCLQTGAYMAQRRFGLHRGYTLVATVPPQHMYGLETSVLLPLVCGITVHMRRPFFPDDIRCALAEVPAPRVLVSTPVHLRACVDADLQWPAIDFIISATAPLAIGLARRIEQKMQTRVLEIYGFSEAGSIASRRTIEGDAWRLYDGLSLRQRNGQLLVEGGHVPSAVPLGDIVECVSEGTFRLLGRNSDMVNVAGKRASLGDLNHTIMEIEGVRDGVFIVPPKSDGAVTRLAALVVAPKLEEKEIIRALAKRVDPAFLPRPLRKVESLPRGETGKLPREELLALLASFDSSR